MIWDFLHRLLYRREIREDIREINEMAAHVEWMQRNMNRRIRDAFTKEEWDAVEARNLQRLRQEYPKLEWSALGYPQESGSSGGAR